ncbi:MFS family permease [Pullulanibacillus pueri]|uniref:Putative MFS-type transporter YkuC n=1 Tax=Pullulanibacillus pueri TaxID=1437324 RepID=A0A8J3EMW6_9BACL|nr:MFS transporter [Pullulanibacillus pueri]MBM7683087.1 MFS family permease [Pullulanibacillus pueri]GGH84847.1 putative MFS-type transporter YkuC [Pullulanibacillus pueri]
MANTFSVFKKMNFTRMFLAAFTSRMGSVIGMTAFSFYLLDRFSEQPFYVSLTEMMYSLPTLVVFFIVGVLADRMDRQKIAANCEWINAGLSLIIIVTIMVGWMPLIFFLLFLRSAVSKFFFPAEQALVQGILSEKEYTTAAGLNQMMSSLFMLFGSGLGIVAYWMVGVEGALLIDGISYIVSGLLILFCKIERDVRLPNGMNKWTDLKPKMMISDFVSGLLYSIRHRLLFALIIGFFVLGIVNGAISVSTMFILKYKLAPVTYEHWSIWEGIVFGLGMIIGSIFASAIAEKFKIYHLLAAGLLISGIFIGAIAFADTLLVYLVFVFLAALFLPLANIAIGGWMPKIVDPKMMGRVEGIINPLMMVSQTLTLAGISVFYPSVLSIEGLFFVVGAIIVLIALYYTLVLPRLADRFDHIQKNEATQIGKV